MTSSPPKSFNKYRKKISITKSDTIGDFKIGAKIGQGTFSKVCMGIHIPTGEKVAIKILPKNQIKEKTDRIRIEKEIGLQKKLHHQNIIHQYSVLDTEDSIYIITEYCSGGELFDYIVSKRRLPEVEACRIFQQLINGLEYLHKQKICHRDLKPENLLFDSKKNLKIADFGLSNEYSKGKLGTPCGSPCYAAPEMVTGQKYMGDTVDIWSSGIVLYSMVCGYLPFEDEDQTLLFHKIAKGLFTLPGYLSYKCKDLIKNILVTNPNKRYGFDEIKNHPWFMSVNNISGKNILFNSPGIIVDYDVIPIDINIIKEMYFAKEYKNFSISNIISDVIKNKHNKITTAYYLFLKKKLRKNEESVSNINSNSKLFIEYIKNPISKMSYWDNDYEKIINYYTKKVKEIIKKKNSSNNYKKNHLTILSLENNDDIIYKEKERTITDENSNNNNNNNNNDKIKENKLKTEITKENPQLETIVYDDEYTEINNNKDNNISDRKKNEIKININNDTEDDYCRYKLTNYELDSDETLMREINNNSFNKKQINDLLKTNENNTIEENKSISSESSDLTFDKIINAAQRNLNRNTKNEKKRVNSVIENNKDIKHNFNLSKEKNDKNKYVYNKMDIDIENKNIKVYKREKIIDNNEKYNLQGMPNNSYLFKKIQSLIIKKDKVSKFINKKRNDKISQNEKGKENKNNYKKVNIKQKIDSKRLQTQENKKNNNNNYHNINTTFTGTNNYKDSNAVDENNYKINNNIKVQNINNYIIDVHKYKINLIGNSNYYRNLNLIEFYKKLNNINRYNKYISSSNKKTATSKAGNKNQNIIIKENYNISIPDNKRNINEYLSPEHITKKIRHLSDLDIPSSNYNFIKNPINQNIKSATVAYQKNKEKFVNKNKGEKLKIINQKIIKSKSDDKDRISKKNKSKKKFKKYSPIKFQSIKIKKVRNKINIPNRNEPNKDLDTINKTFFSNSLINENISKNKNDFHIQTEVNNDNQIKNMKYVSINKNQNKSLLNKKEIYHKKFINLNKRKYDSLENDHNKKKYHLEIANLNNVNQHHNHSLITLYNNQIKNNKNIEKIKKKIINNLTNFNHSLSSAKENKDSSTKKKRFSWQERVKEFTQRKPISNLAIIKDNILYKNDNNNKNTQIKKETKKENVNQDYINNINNNPSMICCKASINKIKEVLKKILSNKFYTINNKNNTTINTYYSNSSIVLRCKLINKLCNLYFELHISLCKDSQKYVIIKPNLLNGNKLFFMKLFSNLKSELLN